MIAGLNSIRFICAFWVLLSHFGRPSLPFPKNDTVSLVLHGIYNNIICGPAAVIVFFVISGFFIHRPFAASNTIPDFMAYYVRRYVRIVVPLAAALVIATTLVPVNLTMFDDSILWSLVAELIYYTLYPALLIARRRVSSWLPLIAVSFLAAFLLVMTDPAAKSYPSFGPQMNWLLGLPCWLMGCWLAEFTLRHKTMFEARTALPYLFALNIWTIRLTVLTVSMGASIARFHSPLGYPWTLNLFAILAAAWLLREIYHFQKARPFAPFEWAGLWSYSLYLVHVVAMTFLEHLGIPSFGITDWLIRLLLVLVLSYSFYLVFERPSHIAARVISDRLSLQGSRRSTSA